MTQIQQDYELKPKQGTFYSQRKEELTSARFLAVRHLAYQVYKKESGKEMMTYAETLVDRDVVRDAVLQYELVNKLILPDYERPETTSRGDIEIVNARLKSLESRNQELTKLVREAVVERAIKAADKKRTKSKRRSR